MLGRCLALLNSAWVSLRTGTPCNPSNRFYGMPVLILKRGARLVLGNHIVALSKARYNEIGVVQPMVFSLLTESAVIEIGDGVGMSGSTLSARQHITVGPGTQIGSGALIMDHDAHGFPLHSAAQVKVSPVRIGRNVFIGARAIILKGVTIGDGAIIGAGAVVAHDVPEGATAVGNPARLVGVHGETFEPPSSFALS